MNEKILIFYNKERIDAFLAAHCASTALPRQISAFIGVGAGDTIPDVTGKYLLFFDVDFTTLTAVPDMSSAVNVVFITRSKSLDKLLPPPEDETKSSIFKGLPKTVVMVTNDYASIAAMSWNRHYTKSTRRDEVMPAFVKYILNALNKPGQSEEASNVIAGLHQDRAFLTGDVIGFESTVIETYKSKPADVITTLADRGRKVLANEMELVHTLIDRNTVMGNFAGHQVKIATIPEEFAHRAGYILAKDMPFSVVYEDRLSESKRVYYLYSTREGLDVLDIVKQYVGATGGPRFATFEARIDFSNQRWI